MLLQIERVATRGNDTADLPECLTIKNEGEEAVRILVSKRNGLRYTIKVSTGLGGGKTWCLFLNAFS